MGRQVRWKGESKRKRHLEALLEEVQECVAEDLQMLRRASDVVVGMRILQQFVIDLLGRNTPTATIFRTKTEAE
jgi:Ni,Fe-hydrogenase III component G